MSFHCPLMLRSVFQRKHNTPPPRKSHVQRPTSVQVCVAGLRHYPNTASAKLVSFERHRYTYHQVRGSMMQRRDHRDDVSNPGGQHARKARNDSSWCGFQRSSVQPMKLPRVCGLGAQQRGEASKCTMTTSTSKGSKRRRVTTSNALGAEESSTLMARKRRSKRPHVNASRAT